MRVVALCALLGVAPGIAAEGASPRAFRRLGPHDGLPVLPIYGLGQDATGFLWLATQAGVGRYDGSRFRKWSERPPRDRPTSVITGRDGEVLVTDQAGALWRVARAQTILGREGEARDSARRALALLPDEPSRERALLLGWWARSQMLRGRYTDAIAAADEALEMAVAVGDEYTHGRALNTIGFSQMLLGKLDEGTASLRTSLEMARRQERPPPARR